MSAEAPSFTHKESGRCRRAFASIIAPEAPDPARQLEVVVVADRSGSMAGEKMNKMKTTLKFLVEKGLQSGDTLGLVAPDNTVDTRLPLTKMDGAGRKKALDAIAQLNVGGTTNLSGGLLQGCDLLLNKPETGATATRAVLLTDGMANAGIQDTPGILAASAGVIAGRSCSLFTFGFGSDHNEERLRALAESTSGLSTTSSRSRRTSRPPSPTAWAASSRWSRRTRRSSSRAATRRRSPRCTGSYKTEADAATKRTTVSLYSEDEKDVLIALELPALPTAAAAAPAVRATLRYFNVATAKMEERSTVLEIARPEATPTAQPLNLKIDEQRNRVALAEAMESASRAADGGRLAEGRELQAAVAAAARTPSAATPLVSALRGDCEKLLSLRRRGRVRAVGVEDVEGVGDESCSSARTTRARRCTPRRGR